MRKKKIFFALVILCLLAAAVWGFFQYQRPRAGVASIEPAYRLRADELYLAYQQNEKEADALYNGKVLEVSGVVEEVQVKDSAQSVLLSANQPMGGVNCSLNNSTQHKALPAKGTRATIKGRCVGFLMDVNLADAIVVQE